MTDKLYHIMLYRALNIWLYENLEYSSTQKREYFFIEFCFTWICYFVLQRPKSLEDNLNETSELQPRPSLSRFNSVKRKQLERLRQRSDWFLGPNSSTTLEQQQQQKEEEPAHEHEALRPKSSGNSITKASSEGAGLDVLSDADSVFSETSRSESPASEPVRTPSVRITRDIIHSDTIEDVQMADSSHESRDTTDEDMAVGDTEVCYFIVEHKYGDTSES